MDLNKYYNLLLDFDQEARFENLVLLLFMRI